MALCGENGLLEKLGELGDELEAKLAEGKAALADIQSKIAEAQEQLESIKLPSIPIKESLQEALEKLKSAIGPERSALEAELKEKFGDAVENLNDLMTAMRNPIDEIKFQADLRAAQLELANAIASGDVGAALQLAQDKLAALQKFEINICDDVGNFQFDPATGKALQEAAESLIPNVEPLVEELNEFVVDNDLATRLQEMVQTGQAIAAEGAAGILPSTQVVPGNFEIPEELRGRTSIEEDRPSGNSGESPSLRSVTELPTGEGFSIAQLSSNAVVTKDTIVAQRGLEVWEIELNLGLLNTYCLAPIKARYPECIVTSGFRDASRGNSGSQHCVGKAADLQFPGRSKDEYDEIAVWIRDNLRFDQLILEYKTTGTKLPWIHISYDGDAGNMFGRQMIMTFMNHRRTGGIGELRDLSAIV